MAPPAVLTRPVAPAAPSLERLLSSRRPQTVSDLTDVPLRFAPFALWVLSHPTPETVIGHAFAVSQCPVAHYVRRRLARVGQRAIEVTVGPYEHARPPQAHFLLRGEQRRRMWLLDARVAAFARAIDALNRDLASRCPITRRQAEPIIWQLLGGDDGRA